MGSAVRLNVEYREGFPHIAGAGGQAAALVGGEGDDGLAVEVDVLEQGEQHLRVKKHESIRANVL